MNGQIKELNQETLLIVLGYFINIDKTLKYSDRKEYVKKINSYHRGV